MSTRFSNRSPITSHKRWLLIAQSAIAFTAVGCGLVTGLSDYDSVPDDNACDAAQCSDATLDGASPANDATLDAGSDVHDANLNPDGPPPCDPTKDAKCLALPAGFQLVAISDFADGGGAPDCPTGFGAPTVVGTSPVAEPDTCTCSCTVTTPFQCTGPLSVMYGQLACTTNGNNNDFQNGHSCNTDLPNNALAPFQKFSAIAENGACSAPQGTTHNGRVGWAQPSRLCDGSGRCASGICDGTVSAPFTACLANAADDGDTLCPSAFPSKRILSSAASFACGACPPCTPVASACTGGSITLYQQSGTCSGGATSVSLDGVCHLLQTTNVKAYTVDGGTTTTTCNPGANPTASSPAVSTSRTICCR